MQHAERIHIANQNPVNSQGRYVLYWMTSARRATDNFGLDRALWWSKELNLPVVVLEAVSIDYPWASQRPHQFIIDGMRDNAIDFDAANIAYFPYVEPQQKQGQGLVLALADEAAVLVTDSFPCFFLPKIQMKVSREAHCLMERIDSNGILPVTLAGRAYPSAYTFRRFMQKHVLTWLSNHPMKRPLGQGEALTGAKRTQRLRAVGVAEEVYERWQPTELADTSGMLMALASAGLDVSVGQVSWSGGRRAAEQRLEMFLSDRLERYAEGRNCPAEDGSSGLAAYLHFGHISSYGIIRELLERYPHFWGIETRKMSGQREGFWQLPSGATAFLDQVITWRELGYGFCHFKPQFDHFDALPEWAVETLENHATDERPYHYELDQFESAQTHDPIWNAAQTQLIQEGRIHNYLRMLWGKKILHWSSHPADAYDIMIHLNNKYAIDGRNPNSYSGISWVLGRFDRPWGPERAVFGKVRYMTSASTAKKFKLGAYLQKYGQTLL